MQQILYRPIITEKSLTQASHGWYTFAVAKSSRKESIARTVAEMYKVDVIEVRTRNVHGKVHRVGRRMTQVIKSDWKKAVVKVKKGQHIDAFEITQQAATPTPEKKEDKKKQKS